MHPLAAALAGFLLSQAYIPAEPSGHTIVPRVRYSLVNKWRYHTFRDRSLFYVGPTVYGARAGNDPTLSVIYRSSRNESLRSRKLVDLKYYPTNMVTGPNGDPIFLYTSAVARVHPSGLGLWKKSFKGVVRGVWWKRGNLFISLQYQGKYRLVLLGPDGTEKVALDVDAPVSGDCHDTGKCLLISAGNGYWLDGTTLTPAQELKGCTAPIFVDREYLVSCAGTLMGIPYRGTKGRTIATGVEWWMAYPEVVFLKDGTLYRPGTQPTKLIHLGRPGSLIVSWSSPSPSVAWVAVASGMKVRLLRFRKYTITDSVSLPVYSAFRRGMRIKGAWERSGSVLVSLVPSIPPVVEYVLTNTGLRY